jgi:hypothetical protein
MWSEPAPGWEPFEGGNREPDTGSRLDAVIALVFVLALVAVVLTAVGWWLLRTDLSETAFQALDRIAGGMGGT